jgi:hypothetical protein
MLPLLVNEAHAATVITVLKIHRFSFPRLARDSRNPHRMDVDVRYSPGKMGGGSTNFEKMASYITLSKRKTADPNYLQHNYSASGKLAQKLIKADQHADMQNQELQVRELQAR